MAPKLIPLTLPPGLYRNGTDYQSSNRWMDANLVRFTTGTIQPIGGWRRAQDASGTDLATLSGVPRAAAAWRATTGPRLAIGTNAALYALAGGTLYDITPTGLLSGPVDAEFSASIGAYGYGPYGAGPYGTGSLQSFLVDPAVWHLDNFGDYLVGVRSDDGTLYVWENDTAALAIAVSGAPTATGVVCTPERFVVALGADGNVRKVQWASQETTATWTAAASNTAGDFELATKGRLVCGRRTRLQTLLFTDTDLHVMSYIGGLLVYRFEQAGDNCGIIGPNAVAAVDTQAFWMGRNSFFRYDGFVKPLPCEVADYVFGDFNEAQRAKVCAVPVSAFGEVWWFYPSATSTENDRYVVYNYREGHWTLGQLARTAGVDAGVTAHGVLCAPDGIVYEHEVEHDRGSEVPYIASGPLELGDGDRVLRIVQIVPDARTIGDVNLRLYAAMDPTSAETEHGPYTLTQPTDARLTARQVRVRYEQAIETDWRVGETRIAVVPGGRR